MKNNLNHLESKNVLLEQNEKYNEYCDNFE